MKSLHLNMYKKINYITAAMVVLTSLTVKAQVTTQSPYSKFGVGNIKGMLLPQFRAMGGISTAVYKPNDYYSNVNPQNPASYAGIDLSTVDVGMSFGMTNLKSGGTSENSFNATLSHLVLGIPVSKKSALSFGLVPYSELGYEFTNKATLTGTGTNPSSQDVNYLYAGEGGLNKAFIGYGHRFGHLNLGANAEYVFGNLVQSRSTELITPAGEADNSISSRMQNKNSVGGFSFSYGMQYDIPLNSKTSIVLGYSGSSASTINSTKSYIVTQYTKTASGDENTAIDSLISTENGKTNLKMPLIHNFGFTIQKRNKWMIGADYRMGKWSKMSIDGVNQGLQDTYGFSVGSQITPDMNSIGSYFNRVDYRLGFQYDKTYIQLNNQDIKQMAVTFGFGFPMARSTSGLAIYKINFTTELGRRGTTNNNLLQENYINFHLGFTLNEKWFRKFRFD